MIGQSLRRVEDPQLLQGRGMFVDDIRLHGALTLSIMRSPHPNARIRSISTDAARRMHGVVDILTGADTEGASMTFLQRTLSELRQPGFDSAGTLQVVRARIVCGLGAYLSQSAVVSGWRSGRLICGPYAVTIARAEVSGVLTNTPPTGVYRGAGRPEATLSIEQIMDTAARALRIDPAAERLKVPVTQRARVS